MRILFWNQEYLPSLGGVEVHTERLARELLARGHEVSVVTGLSAAFLAPQDTINGVVVFRFPFHQVLTARNLDELGALRSDILRVKHLLSPEIVHVNLTDAGPMLHLMTPTDGEATVVAFHRALGALPSAWGLARALARRAAAIVAPSTKTATDVAGFLVRQASEIHVIENGAPPSELLAVPPLPALPPIRFLFAGRLVAEKAPDVAIRATGLLAARGIDIKLEVAGAGPDRSQLEDLADRLGIASRVEFPGSLSRGRLALAFHAASAILVPSIVPETFSQVAAEAALAGRPAVASRIGALPETIVDGETGLLFPPGDVEALASWMLNLAETPGRARQLGEAGRVRAQERYTLGMMTSRYEALYDHALVRHLMVE